MKTVNITQLIKICRMDSTFSRVNDYISHYWYIDIQAPPEFSFNLEFMEFEEFKSINEIQNRTFHIDDPNILMIQLSFTDLGGIKIASEMHFEFGKFNIDKSSIPLKSRLTYPSIIVEFEIELFFEGYVFYGYSNEEAIKLIKEMNESEIDKLKMVVNSNYIKYYYSIG